MSFFFYLSVCGCKCIWEEPFACSVDCFNVFEFLTHCSENYQNLDHKDVCAEESYDNIASKLS
jgi:hypothetical protein